MDTSSDGRRECINVINDAGRQFDRTSEWLASCDSFDYLVVEYRLAFSMELNIDTERNSEGHKKVAACCSEGQDWIAYPKSESGYFRLPWIAAFYIDVDLNLPSSLHATVRSSALYPLGSRLNHVTWPSLGLPWTSRHTRAILWCPTPANHT